MCCGRGFGKLEQTGPGGGGVGETGVTYVHSLSIYYVLVRLLVNHSIRREEQTAAPHVLFKDRPETPDIPSPSHLLC